MTEKHLDILNHQSESYTQKSLFFDENHFIIESYASKLLDIVKRNSSKNILSLGIGQGVVLNYLSNNMKDIDSYTIVEGSNLLIEKYRNEIDEMKNARTVHSSFEAFSSSDQFDIIEMGFILEHVDDPLQILRKYKEMLSKNGTVFIAVPNANSIHRVLGYKAGFLESTYALSAFDIEVGHQRYFDLNTLLRLVHAAELKIINVEGLLLKPFTTKQMNSLNLPDSVWKALVSISEAYPEIANNIIIQVCR